MSNLKLFKFTGVIILLIALTACTELNKKESLSEQDLFEVQRLADTAYQNENLVEGEKHYTTLVTEVPEEALNWFRLGNIYARTQRPDAAVSAYREALVRDPQFTKAWYNMGVVQLKQAAHSLTELQVYTESDQPLYGQSKKLVDAILDILKKDDTTGE